MLVIDQLPSADRQADIVELCGGEGLTTQLLHKRKLRTGANFELIIGIDLTDPKAQDMVIAYFEVDKTKSDSHGANMQPFWAIGQSQQSPSL